MRDPVYGQIVPPVRVVETDRAALERDGLVTALTLEEILPLPTAPDGAPATVCDRMRLLEAQATSGEALVPRAGEETLESGIVGRDGADECNVVLQRRATGLLPQQVPFALAPERAPDAVRTVVIAVPTGERATRWAADAGQSRRATTKSRSRRSSTRCAACRKARLRRPAAGYDSSRRARRARLRCSRTITATSKIPQVTASSAMLRC